MTYSAPVELVDLIREQAHIGWDRSFTGWISPQWTLKQQEYYEVTKYRRTGYQWATALLQKLWNTAWDLWEHRTSCLKAWGYI